MNKKFVFLMFVLLVVLGLVFVSVAAADEAGKSPASAGMAPNNAPVNAPVVPVAPLGSNAYSWNSQNGPYYTIFDIDVPSTLPNIAPFIAPDFIGAGEYVGGLVYMVDVLNNMFEVDPATGAILNSYVATAPPNGETYSGMAVDPTTGIVYASSTNVATSSLFTIDPVTGVATLIGPLPNQPANIAISFDGSGNLYGYDIVLDSMFSINKATGADVNLGPLPFDANFGQGMGYDPATDTVYLAAFNNGLFQAELYTYDTGTNTYTFMGVLGNVVPGGLNQLSWLGFAGGGGDVLHIGDLDAQTRPRSGPQWNGRVYAYVHDASESPVVGATVTALFDDGISTKIKSCVTNPAGRCPIVVKPPDTVASYTYTVIDVSLAGYTYDPGANHDPDGDSDGTTIVVLQP